MAEGIREVQNLLMLFSLLLLLLLLLLLFLSLMDMVLLLLARYGIPSHPAVPTSCYPLLLSHCSRSSS